MNAKADTRLDTGILAAMARAFMRPSIRRATDDLTGLDTCGAYAVVEVLKQEIGERRLNQIFKQIRKNQGKNKTCKR